MDKNSKLQQNGEKSQIAQEKNINNNMQYTQEKETTNAQYTQEKNNGQAQYVKDNKNMQSPKGQVKEYSKTQYSKIKDSKNKENKKGRTALNFFIALIFLVIIGLVFYIAPNYEKETYSGKTKVIINNKNVTLKMKKPIYIENDKVYLSESDMKNYFDKYLYDKNGVITTTSEANIAKMKVGEKNININGEDKTLESTIINKEGILYFPFSDLANTVYDAEVKYIKENNTVIIDSLDKRQDTMEISKKTNLKYKPQIFSRTLSKLNQGDKVIYLNDKDTEKTGWFKVRDDSGNIGYVNGNFAGNKQNVREDKTYVTKPDGKINLVWDYYSEVAKAPDRTNEKMQGVNVVSPSFFSVPKDSDGTIFDNANDDGTKYINWAHSNNKQVWAMVSNNSLGKTTSNILNNEEARERMISNIVNLANKYGVDGINIDFENMNKEDKDLFSRFLIELAPQLKKNGKILSVDVTAPDGAETWSLCFDRNTIGNVADYIIFMAYDQYGPSSSKAGSTASYDWVIANINKFIGSQEQVDPDKLILGIPLYTRLWKEKDGKVTSTVVNMNNILSTIPGNSQLVWKDDAKQYYVEYTAADGKTTYKMWLENDKEGPFSGDNAHSSIQEKINAANSNNLAGIAFWEKSRESGENFWVNVDKYLNQKSN